MAKGRYKPFYKQFLKLKKNIQNRPKIFKFRKQKWKIFQKHAIRQLKFFRRYKVKDQIKIYVPRFRSRGNSLQKKFKTNLYDRKTFSLFYGKLNRKYLKSKISAAVKKKSRTSHDFRHTTIKFFESRLDTVLYRSGFSLSMNGAAQLILHGHVTVNKNTIRTKSFLLKPNDLIEIKKSVKSRQIVKKNLDRSNFWPIPPKYLLINFKTLQIFFLYYEKENLVPVLNHYLSINSVISNIKH